MKFGAPIAVVGMAGVLPGASDPEQFWRNITGKVSAVREIPKHRWGVNPAAMFNPEPRPDKTYSKRASLVRDFQFNPRVFSLDPNLLEALDPLYHLVLTAGKEAFESCNTRTMDRERMGVALAAIALPTVGASVIAREILGKSFEKRLSSPDHSPDVRPLTREQCLAGRVTGLPGALLAEALELGAGAFTLDAACASSLYAIKLACDELHAHRADAMLAGGVSRPDCLYTQVGFSQLRALSPSGRCAPFDKTADGLVVGEGACVFVLKRFEDALRDQDDIHGLIKGIGLSNDIGGHLLAPDSEGQVRALEAAYRSADWNPADVDLIECHGAGTPRGDLTEIRSLRTLWGESGWSREQCAIGSVKSMIGHLLTAAGAAGVMKTLLAFRNRTLPPSLNFTEPPPASRLIDGPFRVQTRADPWPRGTSGRSRRAGVNAFGFGGVNAHLLMEEFDPARAPATPPKKMAGSPSAPSSAKPPRPDIAIVGMATMFGTLSSLKAFQTAVLRGDDILDKRPGNRWKGGDAAAKAHLGGKDPRGGYMASLTLHAGEFHIPPNEIPDILPQHLLMLKTAAAAMADAGISTGADHQRTGVVIGADFDHGAADFHLRWDLHDTAREWARREGWDLDESEMERWVKSLQDALGPPLTAHRTLGALPSVIASRIAREFRFGGSSFVVSDHAASGLKALEIAFGSLQRNETDALIVGAVDLAGDVRTAVMDNATRPFSEDGAIRPFDAEARGSLPGDGAAALVLKRRDQAEKDGDRIYALIKGVGRAHAGGVGAGRPRVAACTRSLERAFLDAGVAPDSVSLVETHGGGDPGEDRVEAEALHRFFSAYLKKNAPPPAIGSTAANLGRTGAASGLASLVKACLCLRQEIIPPLAHYTRPAHDAWQDRLFHMPAHPQYWVRNRKDGPRRACVGAMTPDGGAAHVVLEAHEADAGSRVPKRVKGERRRPLGPDAFGLFAIEGDGPNDLTSGLDALSRHLDRFTDPGQSPESRDEGAVDRAAGAWFRRNGSNPGKPVAITLAARDIAGLRDRIEQARRAVAEDRAMAMNGAGGVCYSPTPQDRGGRVAFVFPGSGSHHVGMGREICARWPEIPREMDRRTLELNTQMIPRLYVPRRISWEPGWEREALEALETDPLNMIFGQVIHGGLMSDLLRGFGVEPDAAIGYSLGETASYFALGAWPDRGVMLERMRRTDLFRTELAGPYNALKTAWGLPENETVDWRAAVVNRPARTVRSVISDMPGVRLLIVNTPDECVVGGLKEAVAGAIRALTCEAIYLKGVVSVHCDAVKPAADAYRDLHVFPTTQPEAIQFYSCALGRAHVLTSDGAADSILSQALHGFDFPATIRNAYKDGVEVFIETGPRDSCTRMIRRILGERPHLAVSASVRGESETVTVLKTLGALIARRIPVNLDKLYGPKGGSGLPSPASPTTSGQPLTLAIGGSPPSPAPPHLPEKETPMAAPVAEPIEDRFPPEADAGESFADAGESVADAGESDAISRPSGLFSDMIQPMRDNIQAAAEAHQAFLSFSEELTRGFGDAFAMQTNLIETLMKRGDAPGRILPEPDEPAAEPPPETVTKPAAPSETEPAPPPAPSPQTPPPAYSREMCMEFAIGSAARVLGPEFAEIDGYDVRVRLPDEPLMLVDRILSVEGEKRSLGPGALVTEHDVHPGAWYLDGGKAPVCISVEAGQADLFLCAYMGIDFEARGKRSYRLLDARVTFHRGLPEPGDVIRYHIEIEKFIRQGETWLFFFNFTGTIRGRRLITMTDGCAGFFTDREIRESGGILPGDENAESPEGVRSPDWKELAPLSRESYDENALNALRNGDLEGCFGEPFKGMSLADSLRLPGGRMKLIDRVLLLDPRGGRFKLGVIRAQADIHPDDWFLTCHFKDDMVMPGTLMYECCAHTLRVLVQRLGWIADKPGVCLEPVIGVQSMLKCRGPVTPETRHVDYEVELKEIGYGPEPYVIADAHMYADDHYIVYFQNITMRMTGVSREEIERGWERRRQDNRLPGTEPAPPEVLFDHDRLLEFALGSPSRAFGSPYQPFDRGRFIARLPNPPYLFISRVLASEPRPWELKPGGWITAEYDVREDDWYFQADRSGSMPFSILLEIALQPCGWLAAYAGSALRSQTDLRFRNLGGEAVQHHEIFPDAGPLTVRARMTRASEAGDMIIEGFDFQVLQNRTVVHEGKTDFGFFTEKALAQQVGIRGADEQAWRPAPGEPARIESESLKDEPPYTPGEAAALGSWDASQPGLVMPGRALRMIDEIECLLPNGGPDGLGFIRGVKHVNPDEWFFTAHFYQDPVCPGSLGVESFIQLIKILAMKRWPRHASSRRFALLTGAPHIWTYRGQIVPENKKVTVEAAVTRVEETPEPLIEAEGYLKVDGRYIYKMERFGVRLAGA